MTNSSFTIQSIGEITEGIRTELQTRKAGDIEKYGSGLKGIDDIIIAIKKTRLYVIGARTGEGKTSLACNLAWNLAQRQVKVMYVSLEMTKEELVRRLICRETRINSEMFELDHLTDKTASAIDMFKVAIKDIKFGIKDDIGYKFKELEDFILSLNPKVDVLFLDHLQMISWAGFPSKHEAVSEYIRKLKELAKTQDIAIVVISQINREGAEKIPTLSQLKSSGAIEEIADVVMLCYWPYNTGARGDYEIFIAKNRHGKVKAKDGVKVHFDAWTFTFEDIKNDNTRDRYRDPEFYR